jgi:hypothetical protein
MKSNQLNFFLTRNDQAELVAKLDPLGEFVYVGGVSMDGTMQLPDSADVVK